VKHKIKKLIKRKRVDSPEYIEQAAEAAPRITNETVAEHREQVLSSARKYILPLEHSRKQVVAITTVLVIAGVVAFFTYAALALYKFHSDSTFIYRITQVIPFPIAKTGGSFVAYENYLFELRRYEHYYQTQQSTNFKDPKSKDQLVAFKKQALAKVVNDAYVKQLAAQNHISVSDKEVNTAIDLVRSQNRLGGSDKVFDDVLKEYWGWSVSDFKRSLHSELLAQKVVSTLDTDTHQRAQTALDTLRGGADFAALAKQVSDDPDTKNNGGEFGYPIDKTTRNVAPQVVDALFKLQPGQYSDIINTGNSLEIVKNIEVNGSKVRAAHLVFSFKDVTTYVNNLKDKTKTQEYIQV
jgi:hypothetical protein